jgi:hypothetical protein
MLRLLMSQGLEEIGRCYIHDATSPSSKGQTASDLRSPRAHASHLICTLQEGEVSLLKLNEQRKTQEGITFSSELDKLRLSIYRNLQVLLSLSPKV